MCVKQQRKRAAAERGGGSGAWLLVPVEAPRHPLQKCLVLQVAVAHGADPQGLGIAVARDVVSVRGTCRAARLAASVAVISVSSEVEVFAAGEALGAVHERGLGAQHVGAVDTGPLSDGRLEEPQVVPKGRAS